MSEPMHFGCACCSPHIMPSFDHASPEWKAQIAELPPLRDADGRAPVIFHGGAIYPDPERPEWRVEAIGIADRKVIVVGSLEAVRAQIHGQNFAEPVTEYALAAGQALLPGLIDPHAHLMTSALVKSWTDLSPFKGQELLRPYNKDVIGKKIGEAVAAAMAADPPANGERWVCGFGVDPSLMQTWEEIDAAWLDGFAPDTGLESDVGLFLLNASGHISYVNTVALKRAHIETTFKTGVLTEENSKLVSKLLPVDANVMLANLLQVFAEANQRGITTLFDAGLGMLSGPAEVDTMRALAKTSALTVRVGAALYGNDPDALGGWLAFYKPELESDPEVLFSLRAIKLIADGSNQGLTGLLSHKYRCCDLHSVPGVGKYGLFNFTPARHLATQMQRAADAGWPILTHANGDEGIVNVLAAYQLALDKVPPPGKHRKRAAVKARHRIEHASLLHDNALQTMKCMSISPSFLIGHVGYWGKAFCDTILGYERAQWLDRCASALAAGMRISLHSDHFVSPFGPLRYMEQAVGRVMEATRVPPAADAATAPVEVLNPSERLSIAQALRAVTIDAAWQCHLDEQIGSLLPGKQADLVILEQDPLTWQAIDAAGMRDIVVRETWVSGRCVYSAAQ
ncbi:Amidohydrolase 3 [Burkholderia gladioli]|uniref:amidohydrolase n=1 Tax=Burkholderia gladioli TaxID=28095 RepID=UPI001CB0AA3E|nr:amidohydrolase [Burkholderia gladioli]CAG9201506.1 Amidohydrolase 3 [Burkholderia gladioli]